MKIGIDARLWSQTGVGRYIRNICLELQKIDTKNEYVLFIRSEDEKNIEKLIKNKKWKLVKANFKWHSVSEQLRFPKTIKKENLDLIHFPYFDVPFFYNDPFVITIHDLIYHHFITGKASTNPIWLYGFKMLSYKMVINNAARKAKKVIAVSQSTRNEIFDHLMVKKSSVEVVYESSDDLKIQTKIKNKYGKYFLFVGNVYPHKNTNKLIRAFQELIKEKDVKLIFIGKKDYFYDRLRKDLSKLIREEKIIIVEDVDDNELANYYANAQALVRPSLMEGFSLAPLEAVNLECLVLASDIPVHKEIFGDSLIYFNPNDFVDLKEKMLYVLDLDKKRRKEKIEKGKQLADKFSWENAARQTLKIYESSISIRQVE